MFNKTIRLLNRRTTKSLVVDERVKLNLAERESIPPKANPFNYDRISMGTPLTNGWIAMFTSETPTESIDLYNTDTGQRFTLDIVPEKEVLKDFIEIRAEENFLSGRLYAAILSDRITEFVDPLTVVGDDHPKYVAFENRLMFRFEKLMTMSPEEVRVVIDDHVLDDDLAEAVFKATRDFVNETIAEVERMGGSVNVLTKSEVDKGVN